MCAAPRLKSAHPVRLIANRKFVVLLILYFIDVGMVEGLGRDWCYTQLTPQSHNKT